MQRLGRESGILKIYKYRGRCNASGNNIRRIREQKQWSQEQLAARLQLEGLPIQQKAISRMETGDRVVADFELLLLAKVLGVCIGELLEDGEGNPR